jgi:hypothetical protein
MAKLRYVGDGEWIRGVPARDLTDDDLKALPKGLGPKTLVATGLYAESKAQADDKPAKPEKE